MRRSEHYHHHAGLTMAEQLAYRVVSGDDWLQAQARGVVPRCGADERDGFVHLSTEDTVLTTANLYFEPGEAPLVLEVAVAELGEALKWEPVESRGGVLFPHLYAPGIPRSAIRATVALVHRTDGFVLGERTELPVVSD